MTKKIEKREIAKSMLERMASEPDKEHKFLPFAARVHEEYKKSFGSDDIMQEILLKLLKEGSKEDYIKRTGIDPMFLGIFKAGPELDSLLKSKKKLDAFLKSLFPKKK